MHCCNLLYASVSDTGRITSLKMPPKSVKNSKICKFYNRGYCKHKEECKEIHSDKVCDDANCNEDQCKKRHPNPCKFGFRCKFNKKKECLFSHVSQSNDDQLKDVIKRFDKKFEKLEN